jgi:predicted ArsR family transcriptional regulator
MDSLFDPDPLEQLDKILLPFQRHSPTSRDAAISMKDHAPNQRERVLKAIQSAKDGLTDEEIGLALDMKGDTVRPRRVELVERGKIRASIHKRHTRAGRLATIWVANG